MDEPVAATIEQKRQPVGPIVAIVVVVLLFALGGLYMFVQQEQHIHDQQAAAGSNS